MPQNLACILYVASLILVIYHGATGKVPLWVPALLMNVGLLLGCYPR